MKSNWIVLLHRDAIALCITLLLSLILLFSNKSTFIDGLEADVTDVYLAITSPQRWYRDILSIKEQNSLLSQKVIQLQLLYSQNEHFRVENDHLRKMLNFTSITPLSLLPANITNRHSAMIQSVIIDVGKNHGIRKNQPVIDLVGLMGKTISVGEIATKVQLITDKNYRVSIRVGEEKSLGIFVPTHGRYGILEGVRKSMNLSKGEIAYTSGISDIYPANIPVARVTAVNNDTDRPFQDVTVEILVDLQNYNYAFVVQ
ncbi:MAG: rod shape-determining protein MreC [Candidatus Marinimicrobia bacterium]|nr:rod shape-determining protein MreC [Candidatus Neomarinimicrobiota bacterium]